MARRDGGGTRGGASASQMLRRPVSSSQPSQQRTEALPPRHPTPATSQRPSQAPSQRPSQPPSQARDEDQPSQSELSGEETRKLVAEVMRHMLFKNHHQPNVPVRREELVVVITKTYKQRHLPGDIISQAQRKLRAVFGFEMKEYVRVKSAKAAKSSNAASQVENKEYVLESIVPAANLRKYVENPGMAAAYSLAVVVVSIIKFSGGEKVPEETLMQNLQRMGIREADVDHPVFGNLKTGLESLAKQRYIQKEKLAGPDGDGFVYELAERALDETFQRRLEDFTSKIVNRDNADTFYER